MHGEYGIDPDGWHGTLCLKSSNQVDGKKHVTMHAYTTGQDDYDLTFASDTPEKADSTVRKKGKVPKVVWPSEEDLDEWDESPVTFPYLGKRNVDDEAAT